MDIVVISPDDFRKYRQNSMLLTNIERIESILNHSCFTNKQIPFIPKKYNNTTREQADQQPKRKIILSYEERMSRELLSNLNKLNSNNMNVVLPKIKKLVDEKNVDAIVNIILAKSCYSGSFFDQYMVLLNELKTCYPQVNMCIINFINNYIDTFSDQINILKAIDYNNYDQFCLFVKEKARLMLINKFTLKYLFEDNNTDSYIELLFNAVSEDDPVHIQDMMIELVSNTIKQVPITRQQMTMLSQLYDDWTSFISCKSKFLLEDKVVKQISPIYNGSRYSILSAH
jgi:hypothetical protein